MLLWKACSTTSIGRAGNSSKVVTGYKASAPVVAAVVATIRLAIGQSIVGICVTSAIRAPRPIPAVTSTAPIETRALSKAAGLTVGNHKHIL